MVRISASERMAQEARDIRDPARQEMYIPRKKGDSTGSSAVNNELAKGLSGTDATAESPQVGQAIQSAIGKPISLREGTKFKNEANTTGITQGPGAGPTMQRPTTDLDSWIDGVLSRWNHPILAEIQRQPNSTPIIERPKERFLTDSPYKDVT